MKNQMIIWKNIHTKHEHLVTLHMGIAVRLNGTPTVPEERSTLSPEKYLNYQQYGIPATQNSVEFPEKLLPRDDNYHNLDQHKHFKNEMWLKMDHRESVHENSYIFTDVTNDFAKFSLLNNYHNSQFELPFTSNDSWTYSTDDIIPSNSHINTYSTVNHSENHEHQKVFDKYSKTYSHLPDHSQEKHWTNNQHDQILNEFSNYSKVFTTEY
ncbi:hypothetical protein A6R68_21690 [Neotoma lepida]|uniref:Uncharacterized protein n=1 Tax=Neotoma lepida TaxID=56216 RepID=A0A1A6HPD5_NEOLE|nr:hypothetical protein A6R68_21690 [Neotoma lepida]